MVVNINRGQLYRFRAKCRNSANEQYAMLVGSETDTGVWVQRICYPTMYMSTPNSADPELDSYNAIISLAKSSGLMYLGVIHSHPDYMPVMSNTDMETHKSSESIISGIVEVRNRRTHVVFWVEHSCLPCVIEYC